MSGKLTRHAYEKLIQENREWLAKQPRTLERDHIDLILRASPAHEYECDSLREQREALHARAQAAELRAEGLERERDEARAELEIERRDWRHPALPPMRERAEAAEAREKQLREALEKLLSASAGAEASARHISLAYTNARTEARAALADTAPETPKPEPQRAAALGGKPIPVVMASGDDHVVFNPPDEPEGGDR